MEEAGPAGVDSTITFENSDNMMELPIIKYDQKQVCTNPLRLVYRREFYVIFAVISTSFWRFLYDISQVESFFYSR